ncbi:NUDIX hydrolase [Streptomyces sp. NBC_01218]|uniref:NUDIX hydrolase n=1 Tax=Streptomyces sp. NBC_01218 TaxID=2903780 RepID=UPI002E127064|nr:NUDIX hydrolase [Streptomyces sp. NBC_01218]
MTRAPGSSRPEAISCDHTSVGVLIAGPTGLLLFERTTPPVGLAPVAGHIDQHGSPEQAARNEVAEEVGLTVTRLDPLLAQWRPNRCRRTATGPVGHQWWIFQAEAKGVLHPSAAEVRAPRWMRANELQHAALRTVTYSQGHLEHGEFERQPGLTPVWCHFLHALGLITLPAAALAQIDTVL